MNSEKCIEALEEVLNDNALPEEYRNELEWISYEDLQDGVDLKEVLDNLEKNYPQLDCPETIDKLRKAIK